MLNMWLLILQATPTLESLKAISVASQLIGDLTGPTLDDPLADRYAKLGCQITPLNHGGEDFKMILNYLSKTIEPIKFNDTVCLYRFEVSAILSRVRRISDCASVSSGLILLTDFGFFEYCRNSKSACRKLA